MGPRKFDRYQQLSWLIVCLCLSLHIAGANGADDANQNVAKSTGNWILDIFYGLLLSIFKFWTFMATGGVGDSECETARCGLGGLFFVSYTGIPGTPSCQETCTVFAPVGQCGVCSKDTIPTWSPVPLPPVQTVSESNPSPVMAPVPLPPVQTAWESSPSPIMAPVPLPPVQTVSDSSPSPAMAPVALPPSDSSPSPIMAPVRLTPVQPPLHPIPSPITAPVRSAPVQPPLKPIPSPIMAPVPRAPVQPPLKPIPSPITAPVPRPPVAAPASAVPPSVDPSERVCGVPKVCTMMLMMVVVMVRSILSLYHHASGQLYSPSPSL